MTALRFRSRRFYSHYQEHPFVLVARSCHSMSYNKMKSCLHHSADRELSYIDLSKVKCLSLYRNVHMDAKIKSNQLTGR